MAPKQMLIDATQPEETRVVIVDGTRLENFDVEVESRRPLKGNIYLAKVTRVEPSLQAAFVDYGGNRHGFLAFNEIHPDYYQIPVADREAILAEDAADGSAAAAAEATNYDTAEEGGVETLGGDDSEEVAARRPAKIQRNYKIQEVIKRRQILLVQVVKEERRTKGAALTTYLSLAGRYCVLMPNTARGGGISRKIANVAERKSLKAILNDFGIPDGMAVIVRTAGSKRSKVEIKRDYDYLIRLWTSVRDLTIESIAPCLVHEEGNLIRRSIRDLYTKDIEKIIIDGENGYRTAKDFMKLLIPSHAKRVQRHKGDGVSLINEYQVESQLDAIHSPEVQLKSGGYIVINPTEALVSIDVNSGRATRERNIEETALKTNLEAATEIARQLRLRDLSGLIVIDFIDMEVNRNQGKVERQLKDAMRSDRARIQIGRISPFGLLELSRQRLRPSLIETSSEPCPNCAGSGVRRSTESTALHMLRIIEGEASQQCVDSVTFFIPTDVALYLFNHKRSVMAEIEQRCKISIFLQNDDSLIPPDHRIELGDDEGKPQAHNTKRATNVAVGDEDGGKRPRSRQRRSDKTKIGEKEVAEAAGNEFADAQGAGSGDKMNADSEVAAKAETTAGGGKRRRRGRRGGRRRGRKPTDLPPVAGNEVSVEGDPATLIGGPIPVDMLIPPDAETDVIVPPVASGDTKEKEKLASHMRRKAKPTVDSKDKSKAKKATTRRRSRKTADTKADAKPSETTKHDPSEMLENPAKQKTRRRKTKVDEVTVADSVNGDVPVPTLNPSPPPPLPDTAPPASARDIGKHSVIEVGASVKDTSARPSRKGWWQRPVD
ncbi:MAG: ribonuclease E/G [Pseudomonadota bacterium]|nr:ribonuclease E/G [Pseudomonadota bacterium]